MAHDRLYWTDWVSDKIQTSLLDGTQVTDLITTGLQLPEGIAIDTLTDKLYWVDSGSGKVQRANLDGTLVEDLVATNLISPGGVSLTICQEDGTGCLKPVATALEQKGLSPFRVYPNPARTSFRLEGLSPHDEIRLYDLAGRLLLRRISAETVLEMNREITLSAGLYEVRIVRSGRVVGREKLMLE